MVEYIYVMLCCQAPASCTMGAGSFPVVKSGRGVTLTRHRPGRDADPSPPSSAVVKKG